MHYSLFAVRHVGTARLDTLVSTRYVSRRDVTSQVELGFNVMCIAGCRQCIDFLSFPRIRLVTFPVSESPAVVNYAQLVDATLLCYRA